MAENDSAESGQIARGTFKQAGGKLVSASVRVEGGTIADVRLDGDFFADARPGVARTIETDDPAADFAPVREALRGLPARSSLQDLQEAVSRGLPGSLELIGIDARGIALAVRRALGKMTGESAQSVQSAQSQGPTGPSSPRFLRPAPRAASTLTLTPSEIRARWERLGLAMIDPKETARHPYPPAMQMALDEVISRHSARGEMPPLLRFWHWAGPAVVLGRFQSLSHEVNQAEAKAEGIAIVRRETGGGAMFVEPGNTITYSLTVPFSFVEGLSAEDRYLLCDGWVIEALRSIGVDARHSPFNDIASSAGKIGGAAQKRYESAGGPGALLHHTTMAYDIDAAKMNRILTPNRAKLAAHAVASAAKRVDPIRSQSGLSRSAVIEAMGEWIRANVPAVRPFVLPQALLDEARALAARKYENPDWTGRIA